MRYVAASVHSAYYPKLLGTYERELNTVISTIAEGGYGKLINVGAAEGYFAVGLALRMPKTAVVAFEQSEVGRNWLRQLAELNGVYDRIDIRSRCTPQALSAALAGEQRTCVLMDVEGAERELLDPVRQPALRTCDILVEVHEFLDAGLADVLAARFAPWHRLTWIAAVERNLGDLPFRLSLWRRKLLAPAYVRALSEERPPGMRWAWLVA